MGNYCCCLADEIDGDKFAQFSEKFQVTMCEAWYKNCPCFCASLIFPCCTQFSLRKKALHGDMTRYKCCQGYFDCCCFKAGSCGEKSCPYFCLCLESFCCANLAVSATRMHVMEEKKLHSDPCDRRMIRCNNCVFLLSCVCNCLSICFKPLREVARCLTCVSECTYCVMQGCMSAQVHYELSHERQAVVTQTGVPASAPPIMSEPVKQVHMF